MADFMNLPSKEVIESQNTILQSIADKLGVTTGALEDAINLANTAGANAEAKAIDVENRFQQLTASQQQDAEVVSARQSTSKNKTFASLDARMEEDENDLKTHKAEKVSKVVSITRDLSLAGTQVITGIGFKPKSVIAMATVAVAVGKYSIGFGDETLTSTIIADYGLIASNTYVANPGLIKIFDSDANNTVANIQSYDSDGLTLNWTKSGTGATGTVVAILLLSTH